MALVPVRLDALVSGRPMRFALICAPNQEDFSAASRLSGKKNIIIKESGRANSSEQRDLTEKEYSLVHKFFKLICLEDISKSLMILIIND